MTTPPHRIYHLAVAAEWEAAVTAGDYRRSTVGRSLDDVGFVHCSFAHQVQAVADAMYGGTGDVVLLELDAERVGDVRVDDGFPHVYGPLPLEAVVRSVKLDRDRDGRLVVAPWLEDGR